MAEKPSLTNEIFEISEIKEDVQRNRKNDSDYTARLHLLTSTSRNDLEKFGKNELLEALVRSNKKSAELDGLIFEMRTLLQSGKGLGDILNLSQLLATFMAVVRERYGTVNSTVLLMDDLNPKDISLRLRSYYGLPDMYSNGEYEEELYLFNMPVVDGLLWQIIKQGEVFSVQDLKHNPRFKIAWQKWNLDVLKSDIWCPLIKKGEVKGVLTLGLREDNSQIPSTEYGFLQDLASIAVTNIDSVLKYEKNEIILRNVRTLYDINQQLANVNDFKQLCIETLATAVSALKAQKGNLMLLNEQTQELEIKVVWGNIPTNVRDSINSGAMQTKSFRLGEGVAGIVAETKKPLRENDRSRIEQVGKNIVYAMLTVPLLRAGQLVGVINMTNKVKPAGDNLVLDTLGRFTEEDEALMMGLADQAAGNLHKAKLYNASITDKKTGLFNARHFDFELTTQSEKAISQKRPLSLAVSDIDHFKKFNDTYGHNAGDEVLIAVAKVMTKISEQYSGTQAFRYGGEEYCLIMPETDTEKALNIMEQYRSEVENLVVMYEGKELRVTVSIGVATVAQDASSAKDLFLRADEALYACKEGGRNQVRGFFKGEKRGLTNLKKVG